MMIERVYFNSYKRQLEVLFEKQQEIQAMEEDLAYLKEQWRCMGEVIRSWSQSKAELYSELLKSISRLKSESEVGVRG